MNISIVLCWFSTFCSTIQTYVYWKLGYRYQLLTFLSASLLLQHAQKLYLITVRNLFPWYYEESIQASLIILLNAFFVSSYNLSLVAICLHVYLLIQAAGSGYDHLKAQTKFIQVICLLSAGQLLHVLWFARDQFPFITETPFLYMQTLILFLQVVLCAPLLAHLLWKCYRARERTIDLLRRSSISTSMMWRLMFALVALTLMSTMSLYLQISNAVAQGGRGGLGSSFDVWRATPAQLANRYQVGSIVGPVLMLIFLSAQEPLDFVKDRLIDLKDSLLGHDRRKSSVPWIENDSRLTEMLERFSNRGSVETQFSKTQSGSSGSLDPRVSARQESVDMYLPRRCSTGDEVETGRVKTARSSSLAPAATGTDLTRSDSIQDIVIHK